jgi:UDP-glucuronate 4-epimerase
MSSHVRVASSMVASLSLFPHLYGVTKRTNDMTAIGLAFVRLDSDSLLSKARGVRPDMAPSLFKDSISKGNNITVFNQGRMSRDFTFVDDIVAGILSAMRYKAIKHAVFNLGNPKPC